MLSTPVNQVHHKFEVDFNVQNKAIHLIWVFEDQGSRTVIRFSLISRDLSNNNLAHFNSIYLPVSCTFISASLQNMLNSITYPV